MKDLLCCERGWIGGELHKNWRVSGIAVVSVEFVVAAASVRMDRFPQTRAGD